MFLEVPEQRYYVYQLTLNWAHLLRGNPSTTNSILTC